MIKWTKSSLFLLLYAGILQSFFNVDSSTILAQGTETTHLTHISSSREWFAVCGRTQGQFLGKCTLLEVYHTNLSIFISGRRSREEGDTRDDLPAYALLNFSVLGKGFFKIMEIQGTVYNLLDKDYSDPGLVSIPEDLPRPGRCFLLD